VTGEGGREDSADGGDGRSGGAAATFCSAYSSRKHIRQNMCLNNAPYICSLSRKDRVPTYLPWIGWRVALRKGGISCLKSRRLRCGTRRRTRHRHARAAR